MATSKTPSLFDTPRAGTNMPEFSVSELSNLVKKTVEEHFGLVRVRGEISECKAHTNGHVYLTLKEGTSILASVCWRGQVGKLAIKPAIGMEVVCTGRLTTYAGQSKYQLVIEGMALAGIGALLKLLEERKKKLAAEGLFDPARKRPLPYLPNVIGVVTSPTGAVIRDILHRLDERFPRRVLVWPVAVQGEGAAEQVAAAINGFNGLPECGPTPRPDILIVARGGGSVEDLMPFNEECVVRAVANSKIPVISAVGHETDTTLIDYASDLRAPTPTAAAEKAVPVRADLLAEVHDDGTRLFQAALRLMQDRRERLRLIERALGDPARVLEPLTQRLDEKAERFTLAWRSFYDRNHARMTQACGRLRHPRDVLNLATQRLANAEQRMLFGLRALHDKNAARLGEASSRLRHPKDILSLGTQRLMNAEQRMAFGLRALCDKNASRLVEASSGLRQPKDILSSGSQRLMNVEQKLTFAWGAFFTRKTNQFEQKSAGLELLSPRAVLGRGYALIQDSEGRIVSSTKAVKPKDKLTVELQDGTLTATAD
jgi:exodeoxyribonuclease VII large subunit